MDNILLLNNQKLIVAEFNISINETTKFIISFRFVHKWQIQKVLNYSFLISIQYVNFYRRTSVNVAKDTRVVRKVCGHRDLRKNDCVFWKKTYVLSNDCLSKKQMILIFFSKYIAIITLHELDIRRTTSHIQDVRWRQTTGKQTCHLF